jgi:O-antigen ligase
LRNRLNTDLLDRMRTVVVALAVAGPMLLAFNAPPSPTVLNGLLALGGWGAVLATLRAQCPIDRSPAAGSSIATLLAAGIVVCLSVLGSLLLGTLPATIAAGAVASIGVAVLVVWQTHRGAETPDGEACATSFFWGLAAAGTLSAVIAGLQVFAPDWPDGTWIARSSLPGRAGANLRQPNHLSSLLLWAMVAVVALAAQRRVRPVHALVVQLVLMLALVLTGSRTGIIGTVLLALWGLIDRRLPRALRRTLMAAPAAFVLLWLGAAAWAHATNHVFSAENRLSLTGGDVSSSRFAIWSNALAMIRSEPWHGVGFGEFNIAWTLTTFPDRPTAFFDHTHNLPLQLVVELGVPLGLLVVALLAAALFQAGRRSWAWEGEAGVGRRAAFIVVVMIALHSMLEYPLWYSYFLLPTAFAWAFALSQPAAGAGAAGAGSKGASPTTERHRWLTPMGLAIGLGAAGAALDYSRVAMIYEPPEHAATLEERIGHGQRSPLFGHHADYAAATAFGPPKAPLSPGQELAFRRAPHQLLDVRLMIAWSQALASQGDLDKARWLAARIREFRNPGADEYFAPCQDPSQAAQAFQCQPPTRVVHWREFTQP